MSSPGLISSALPANDDNDWYGEFPYPVGPTGRACHQRCPAAHKRPIRENAPAPRSPIPYGEGKEVTCNSRPEARESAEYGGLVISPAVVIAPLRSAQEPGSPSAVPRSGFSRDDRRL